jgi:L-ribulose-5-phosphate 4-epimerase
MNETGVVKFHYECDGCDLAPFAEFEGLNAARQEMRRLGVLGVGESGIGFGNISLRDAASDCFWISGSATGVLQNLTLQDYARVVAWDFERNWLRCEGRLVASAESLTHAAVYSMDQTTRVVLHGHCRSRWEKLQSDGIASRADVPYGTPEMAREVQRLFRETDVRNEKIFAMSGHADGFVAFGGNSEEALAVLALTGS